jgi:hypothetical protein
MAELIARANHPEECPATPPLRQDVAPTIQQLLDSMDATPAFVIGPGSDLLAWNRPWERLATPLGLLDDPLPNLARYVFRHPHAQATFPDWSTAAHEQVSNLHAAARNWGDDPAFGALLEELLSEPEFAARWATHDVSATLRGTQQLHHPDIGELSIAYETLDLPDGGGQRVITWLPADDATATAIRIAITDTTATDAPKLRLVGES